MEYKGTKANVYDYLKKEPRARERRNKYKTITNLIQKRYKKAEKIDRAELVQWVFTAIKYDRDWRHVTQKHRNLQGKDYKEKARYTKKALLEYGYKLK